MTEITDEMVERAYAAFDANRIKPEAAMRRALDSTLNPPAEPHAQLPPKMIAAGMRAWAERPGTAQAISDIYIAMHRLEPKAGQQRAHCRLGEPLGQFHRRSTD